MATRIVLLMAVMALARPVAGQRVEAPFEVSGTFVTTDAGQFHTRDIGIGGRLGWRLSPVLGLEAELTYHSDPFGDAVPFKAGRVEGLFGATLGPRLGALR